MAAVRVSPWVPVLMLVCAIATSMSLGSLHALQGADSIVPVLVSLQHWTPFFWQQDRFGMLVPLLAMPLRDPLSNLVVQGWLMAVAALAAPFVIARLLVRDPRHWFVAGTLTNIFLFLLAAPDIRFDWLVVQPYALSMTLAAAALIASERRGRMGLFSALLLMLLAHWVNVGVAVLAVPLALLRRRSFARAVAVTFAGASAGIALTRLSPYRTTTALLSPAEWPHGWLELKTKAPQAFSHPPAAVAVAVLAAAAAAVLWTRSRAIDADVFERQQLRAAGIAVLAAAIYWLTAGASRWVQINLYFPRYIYPSLLMCGVAAGIVIASLLPNPSRPMLFGAALALCVLVLVEYGMPSRARLRATLDSRLGALTPDLIASGATVVGGNYWVVWPAVFHANLTTYRRNGPAVYGLTYRSAATNDVWKNTIDLVLAAPAGDRIIESYASRAGLTITRVERRGAVDVFVIRKGG